MRRALLGILLCFFVAFAFLASCDSESEKGNYITFKDSLSNTVSLDKAPTRVAVLFSSYAEMWILAGGEVAITVGESVERGFVDKDTLLVDTGAGKHISVEQLIAYNPDFVIYSADISAQLDAAKLLMAAGITSAGFKVEDFSDYLSVFRMMTNITKNEAAYRKYGSELEEKINLLLSEHSTKDKKNVLFIRAATSAKATKAKDTKSHFAAKMLVELGCRNIADYAPILLDGLSIEVILKENPDFIFISSMGEEKEVKAYMDSVLSSELWQKLDAVKNGKCYYLSKDMFHFKPNGDWYEAYLVLWEILYET